MPTVSQDSLSVKSTRSPGRPPLRTPTKEREIIRLCVRSAIVSGQVPSDAELSQVVDLGERTVRAVRLDAGLNRWDIAAWVKAREAAKDKAREEDVLCWTPYAGLWLLVPLILRSALLAAAQLLQWTAHTRIDAWQWVLTVMMWAVLGFRRFFHLDDFRHQANLGLALFTGRTRLLADSTVWHLVHTLQPERAEAFYQRTAAEAVAVDEPDAEAWLSMDDHVVGFFTKLKPRPLGKTRVASRGRYYPAIRLYPPFHLSTGRYLGLVVTQARYALSQVLPRLIAEVRKLQALAGHPQPSRIRVLLDRGGYKATLFEELMEDPTIRFIAMARATPNNVRQWETVPESSFTPYQRKRDQNPNLKIADTQTRVNGCVYPLRTVLIRDDMPGIQQRWRALFTTVPSTEMSPEEVDATYRRRQDHENSFAELDHYLAGKCLPKPYRLIRVPNHQGQKRKTVATELSSETMTGMKVVAWLRHWAFNLVKDFGAGLGQPYATLRVGTLVRRFIARPGILSLRGNEIWITLMPFTGHQALAPWIQHLNQQRLAVPWLNHWILQMEVAAAPFGLAANPRALRRRVFANSGPPMAP